MGLIGVIRSRRALARRDRLIHIILDITLVILIISSEYCFAEPRVQLSRLFDHNQASNDIFADTYHCNNGDYLVCGQSGQQVWMMRLEPDFEPVWSYFEDGIRLNSIIEADNGDAVATGGWRGALKVIRISRDGEVVWIRAFDNALGAAIIELKAGDFVVSGSSNMQGYVLRLDAAGNSVWSRRYQGGAQSSGFRAMRERDGDIVLAGDANSDNRVQGWLHRINDQGDVIWSRLYNVNNEGTSFWSMTSLAGGGFAIAGLSRDWIVFRIDSNGNHVSHSRIQEREGEVQSPYGIDKLADGGLVVVGWKRIGDESYPIMVRLDNQWRVSWTKNFIDILERRDFNNQLQSVITVDGDVMIACGIIWNPEQDRRGDALLIRLEPDNPFPHILYHIPEDTLLTTLQNDNIQFILRASDQFGREMSYQWFYDEQDQGSDTTTIINFEFLGEHLVTCQVSNDDGRAVITWHITVSDLFIARHTPDTLALTLRRGASQAFTLDSVAAVQGDDPIQYLWTLADLTNQQSEEIGEDSSVTVDFVRSGNFAVTGEAYRGDASDAVTWRVAVRGAVLDFVPPALELTVRTDTTLHFEVFAFNPGSDSLSYAWYYGEDLIGLDSTTEVIFGPEEGEYQIRAVVMDGAEGDTVVWRVRTVAPDGIEDCRLKIADWGIKEAWPNPFNSLITIRYQSAESVQSADRLTIHDISGREVARLTGNPPFNSPPASKGGKESGIKQGGNSVTQSLSHSVTSTWDASDMPAGVYFIRLQAGSQVAVKKVVLMR
jgi:hypothetical protein